MDLWVEKGGVFDVYCICFYFYGNGDGYGGCLFLFFYVLCIFVLFCVGVCFGYFYFV